MSDIRWYETLDSTNDEARRHISILDNLSVTAARSQTAGRGQGDHCWHSKDGENILASMVLKFGDGGLAPLAASDSLLITEAVTLGVRLYLKDKGIEARIKWPNDIWCGDRKICGILIENILSGQNVVSSIVGFGLNLNQTVFPADLPNPVSLSQLTGNEYEIEEELRILVSRIGECFLKTDTAEGRRYLDKQFNEYMFRLS